MPGPPLHHQRARLGAGEGTIIIITIIIIVLSSPSLSPVEVDHDGLAPQRRGHRWLGAPELGPGLVGAGGVENRWRQHSQVGQPQLGFSCHLVKLLHSCHVIQLLDSCCQQARTQLIARPAPAQAISIITTTIIVPLTCSSGPPSS